MNNSSLEQLKYPIGHFNCPKEISDSEISKWITVLEHFPQKLQSLVANLSEQQLNTVYRPGGWTVKQLIHHIADSHHHSYTRFKWALAEDNPIIKAYEEKDWASLVDSRTAPIALSLNYITALHAKMVFMLKGLSPEDLQRCYVHPVGKVVVSISENMGKYAWHSNHHYAHIENLCNSKGWL